jgi:RNA polymerase sigma-70 factor (ECF subfamily)
MPDSEADRPDGDADWGDADWVERARAGERDAFAELFRRHAARIGAVCCARVGWRGPVEDMVQETFTRAWRELGELRASDGFAPWLRGIALRACADWQRRAGREQRLREPGAEPFELASRERGPADQESRALLDAVEALPEIYRETVTLFYFGERSHAEIAATLGIGPAAVNARLGKARALLRESLARDA